MNGFLVWFCKTTVKKQHKCKSQGGENITKRKATQNENQQTAKDTRKYVSGFSFSSHCLKNWHQPSWSIAEGSK